MFSAYREKRAKWKRKRNTYQLPKRQKSGTSRSVVLETIAIKAEFLVLFFQARRGTFQSQPKKPERSNKKSSSSNNLLSALLREMRHKISGGIYHRTQIDLTFNSNHMEGSRLTFDQTRHIFETRTIECENDVISINDLIETTNHFRCIDKIIDKTNSTLTEKFIKDLHRMLKTGTNESQLDWFAVGDYKRLPNEVANMKTPPPEEVASEIRKLLTEYNSKEKISFNDILDFHVKFERIHPFQDGNGRVGRLIMFKECLKNRIVPFIIEDALKMYYYRGLAEWDRKKGFLTDTCLAAQDKYKLLLDYFRIAY